MLNIIGGVFGRLTVTKELPRPSRYVRKFLCRCECGGSAEVLMGNLRSLKVASCGCLKREILLDRNQALSTHGMSKTPEYTVWIGIRRRCEDPKDKSYPRYGGRGILVCQRWGRFENFIFDMGPRPSPRHQIERLNNVKGYSPDNCVWDTTKAQSRNKRNNIVVAYAGRRLVLRDACDAAGLNYWTVWSRIQKGWPREQWFQPVR